jgi:hypothetical protein
MPLILRPALLLDERSVDAFKISPVAAPEPSKDSSSVDRGNLVPGTSLATSKACGVHSLMTIMSTRKIATAAAGCRDSWHLLLTFWQFFFCVFLEDATIQDNALRALPI